jgi:DNA-binding NarL/FixJ family response regulator
VKDAVRVLVCDDQTLIRARVREALAGTPDIQVVGEAAGGLEGIRLAIELLPDLVLMDISMPDLDGIQATQRILAQAPDIRVLAFSADSHWQNVEEMFFAGAWGYLLKRGDSSQLIDAIHSVMAGSFFLSASIRGSGPESEAVSS